jgi:hypothetical protein
MSDAAAAPGSEGAAQAVCKANALVGCVEQMAAQPYIVKSMNVPVTDMFCNELEKELNSEFSTGVLNGGKDALRPLAEALDDEFDRLRTEWLMKLNLPGMAIRLGVDVRPPADGQMYPAAFGGVADAPAARSDDHVHRVLDRGQRGQRLDKRSAAQAFHCLTLRLERAGYGAMGPAV